MKTPLLFWCAAALAVCAVFLLLSGVSLTLSRTVAGADAILSPGSHKLLAEVVGTLTILLALALTFAKTNAPSFVRIAGWLPVAAVIADAVLGAAAPAASNTVGFLHSLLAHLFVSAAVAVAAVLSLTPVKAHIPDKGWPSLRGYATLTCVFVIVQVTLGAAFRHDLMGVMSHIIGALLLALFILGLAMLVLNLPAESAPEGNPLRAPAIVLMILAGVQVTLGLTIASLSSKSGGFIPMAVSHAAIGSLTLASTVVLTILVRHHTRRIP